MLKIVAQMLQRSYSVDSQMVSIKSLFTTKLIHHYPWVISDVFATDTRDKGTLSGLS